MKWFVLGIIVTLVVLCAIAYIYLEQGFVSARADVKPGTMDSWLGSAMDASTTRHAPKLTNPAPDTPDTLLAGARTYTSLCAGCHGTPVDHDSKFGKAFYPPAPQFFGDDPPDMKENENFYIIKHGVRMTAMPAWGDLVSDQQIWQTVALLKHVDQKSVPAEVQRELNAPKSGQ